MKKENVEKKQETGSLFIVVSLLAFLVTLILSFIRSAFIPSCMLMLSLLLFSICYRLKDNDKKTVMYILYVVGILLIICSLIYTYTRIY